jgi:hypothetical protein
MAPRENVVLHRRAAAKDLPNLYPKGYSECEGDKDPCDYTTEIRIEHLNPLPVKNQDINCTYIRILTIIEQCHQ